MRGTHRNASVTISVWYPASQDEAADAEGGSALPVKDRAGVIHHRSDWIDGTPRLECGRLRKASAIRPASE